MLQFDGTVSAGQVLTVISILGACWRVVMVFGAMVRRFDARITMLEQSKQEWVPFLEKQFPRS